MDWKAKRHITQQLDSQCNRKKHSATNPEQHKQDIKKHRETVVHLIEQQICQCNCKFIGLIQTTHKCKETRSSTRIFYGIVIFAVCVVVIYAAMIYGAIFGASQCSKDEYGCAHTITAKLGIPGLRFKRNRQHGIM